MNITNGTPAGIIDSSTGTDNDGTDASDRFSTLLTSGLPPDPVHLRISNDSGSGVTNLISVGTEIFTAGERELTTKTHWYTE